MDLSAPISYNSITFSPPTNSPTAPKSGYEIEDINPSAVGSDGYFDPRALQDGMDASDVRRRARHIDISAAVYGTSKGQVWDNAQSLLAAFNPVLAYNANTADLGFLAFDFQQPTINTATWTAAYIPMRYYARPANDPVLNVNRLKTMDNGRGFALPVQLSLVCRDPRKYNQTQISTAITTATQTATYRGDYPSLPVVQFNITAAGNSAFTVVVNSTSIVINAASATAFGTFLNKYTLNFEKRTLTVADATLGTLSAAWLITSAPDYPGLSPGSTFKFANATNIANCNLIYREAWS